MSDAFRSADGGSYDQRYRLCGRLQRPVAFQSRVPPAFRQNSDRHTARKLTQSLDDRTFRRASMPQGFSKPGTEPVYAEGQGEGEEKITGAITDTVEIDKSCPPRPAAAPSARWSCGRPRSDSAHASPPQIRRARGKRSAGPPAIVLEQIGSRGQHIWNGMAQINVAVAVEVDAVLNVQECSHPPAAQAALRVGATSTSNCTR